jgi:hypothetical protein
VLESGLRDILLVHGHGKESVSHPEQDQAGPDLDTKLEEKSGNNTGFSIRSVRTATVRNRGGVTGRQYGPTGLRAREGATDVPNACTL